MPDTPHLLLRGARDRLVDLLGLGKTSPLQDPEVGAESLTVAFNTSARIPICPGQDDVLYTLHDERQSVPGVTPLVGTDAEISLVTPPIQEDVTYEVFASKIDTGRTVYLLETASVKVGLDTALAARIRAPALDPSSVPPADTGPRLADYGSRVEVEVDRSQEGVDYRLVLPAEGGHMDDDVILSESDVRGDLGTIVLTTEPVYEDLVVRIRAIKTFDPSEGRDNQDGLLDVALPLKVRANLAVAVTVDPSPVIGLHEGTTLRIADSQSSVRYRPWVRTLSDEDFVYGTAAPEDVVRVAVDGAEDVRVFAPPRSETWQAPPGFSAQGELRPGTGGDLLLTLESLDEDSLVVVEARKEHPAADLAATIPSAVQLNQAALVLVRPDPDPGLAMEALSAGSSTLIVTGGQPGVFYYFRPEGGEEYDLPAYFHKGKGLDRLRVEVDFVVARDPSPRLAAAADPVIEIDPPPLDGELHVRAVKARTGVGVELPSPLPIRMEGEGPG